ncbi:hypothetical protein TVAG_269850 [Trichomonas vaginalis G3]|uniref:Uncharacterized protein n=1 Tax=Trichomonas vaginalis (strain ATCC PRA-98 / G3) TaxID=412133 RepID=A2G1Q4_TRIV3|nr:hypothetical protein TVAGG3_0913360 [Trichomonas vaginalis G3]EAX88914.1 hypothetical protein TVAG_269850 [Trichomonas vaginalis G3]KAI5484592.1 hypothetical protein TVAGG3_0913360 [Trichomonas vaginalis G3]|eukprot:XP_001301844.1 hypothetical protein [Trichomonas vaginalis G3]
MNSVTDGQQNIDQPTIVLEAYPTNSPLSRESHVQLPIEEASGALIEYENEQSQIHEEEQLQTQEEEDFAEIINNNLSHFPMEFAMEMIKKIYQEKSQSEETLSQLYQGLSKLMGDDKIYESFLNEYLTIKHKQMKSEQAARAREGKYKKKP